MYRSPSRSGRTLLGVRHCTRGVALLLALLLLNGCCRPTVSEALRSGELRRTSLRVATLDPALAADVPSARAVLLLYDCLLRYSYLDRPYRLEPGLAEAMPDVTDNGCTWRFRLRPDARFSDDPCFSGGHGRAVTATDVVHSLKRLADAKVASSGSWTLDGHVEGWEDFHQASRSPAPTDYDRPIAGLRAMGPHELEIRLTAPYPQLPWVLAMAYTAVVPREAVDAYGTRFASHAVGSGPFVLGEWRRNHRMEFLRRGPIDPAGVRRMIWSVMDDPTTEWMSFLGGGLDILGEIARDNWDAVFTAAGELTPGLAERGVRLTGEPALDVWYIGFNMEDPVVGTNRALREAMDLAFDRAAWAALYRGRIVPAHGPVPPGVAGYREGRAAPACNFDAARRRLAEAGYPGGIDPSTGRRLELALELGRTDSETRESTELFVSFMDRIGIVVRPSYNNWPAFLAKVSRREAQMFRLRWLGDYPDAQNFLQLFYGPNASPGPNRSNYANADFDRMYESFAAMPAGAERDARCAELEDLLARDVPWLVLGHSYERSLYRDRVVNYSAHAFPYGMERHYHLRDR